MAEEWPPRRFSKISLYRVDHSKETADWTSGAVAAMRIGIVPVNAARDVHRPNIFRVFTATLT